MMGKVMGVGLNSRPPELDKLTFGYSGLEVKSNFLLGQRLLQNAGKCDSSDRICVSAPRMSYFLSAQDVLDHMCVGDSQAGNTSRYMLAPDWIPWEMQ